MKLKKIKYYETIKFSKLRRVRNYLFGNVSDNGVYKAGDKQYYKPCTKEQKKSGWVFIPHRMKGPSSDYTGGTKIWQKNGINHRIDGPAKMFDEEEDFIKEFWFNDEFYYEEKFWNK